MSEVLQDSKVPVDTDNLVEVTLPTRPACNMCEAVDAAYDGATVYGPWAYMCEPCFGRYGVGLGTGRGQRIATGNPIATGGRQNA